MAQFTNKKDIIGKLQNQIEAKDATAVHALLFIADFQGKDEMDEAYYRNGVGFNKLDAKIGCNLAEQYKRYGRLSMKQLLLVKKLMRKYAKQIVDIKLATGEIKKDGNLYIW